MCYFGMFVVLTSYVINFTYSVKPDSFIGLCVLIVEYCLCLLNFYKFSVICSMIYQQMQYHFTYCMCICGYNSQKTCPCCLLNILEVRGAGVV